VSGNWLILAGRPYEVTARRQTGGYSGAQRAVWEVTTADTPTPGAVAVSLPAEPAPEHGDDHLVDGICLCCDPCCNTDDLCTCPDCAVRYRALSDDHVCEHGDPRPDLKETPMADKKALTKLSNDTWQLDGVTNGSSGRIRMERSMAGKKEVLLRLYDNQSGISQGGNLWLSADDIDELATALKTLSTPVCTSCKGTGVQQP
jgi:hypothetical protein